MKIGIGLPNGSPVLFGGTSTAAIRRVTQLGDGWVSGALRDHDAEAAFADRVQCAWLEADRPGNPGRVPVASEGPGGIGVGKGHRFLARTAGTSSLTDTFASSPSVAREFLCRCT